MTITTEQVQTTLAHSTYHYHLLSSCRMLLFYVSMDCKHTSSSVTFLVTSQSVAAHIQSRDDSIGNPTFTRQWLVCLIFTSMLLCRSPGTMIVRSIISHKQPSQCRSSLLTHVCMTPLREGSSTLQGSVWAALGTFLASSQHCAEHTLSGNGNMRALRVIRALAAVTAFRARTPR